MQTGLLFILSVCVLISCQAKKIKEAAVKHDPVQNRIDTISVIPVDRINLQEYSQSYSRLNTQRFTAGYTHISTIVADKGLKILVDPGGSCRAATKIL